MVKEYGTGTVLYAALLKDFTLDDMQASPHPPPPRTSPPSVPPLDALPSISSPGLVSPGQCLVERTYTAGSSGPGTSNSSHVSAAGDYSTHPPTTSTTSPTLTQLETELETAVDEACSKHKAVHLIGAAAQPPSLAAPADGSSSHHNLSSGGSGSNNAANQGVGIGGYPVPTTITSSYRKKTKLTLLNPMSFLMRRRSWQASSLLSDSAKARNAKDLPGDFDPGIIYGTRHLDCSNAPKRGQNEAVRPPVNGRSISPLPTVSPLMDPNNKLLKVEVVADDAGRKSGVYGREGRGSGGYNCTPAVPTRAAPEPLRVPTTNPPPIEDSHKPGVVESGALPSSTGPTTQISRASSVMSSNEGDLDDEKPRGVTLVDLPLSLPHHLMTNSSRFSLEESSAAESNKEEPEEPYNDYDDDGDRDVLPAMNPEPAAMQPEQPSLLQRLGNPRVLDLNSDSDFDKLEQGDGIAGYGDDDDDLYFDDGIILNNLTVQSSANNPDQEEGGVENPGALSGIGGGYESDYTADWGSPSGYHSIDDDEYEPEDADDSMVAEANAETLAYDAEFYGQEFGFYPILRPISKRSESSYRNSLVFPVSSSRPLSATVPAGEDIGSLTSSNSGGGGITLEQLMRLRRDAWGGSNGSLRSSRGSGTHSPVPANSSLLAQGATSPPPQMPPPGFAGGGVVGAPPGLSHAGKNAMLPTKTSLEDVGLPPPSEVATTESGSRYGRSTTDSSYASAVGFPIGDCEVMDAEDGNGLSCESGMEGVGGEDV
ncbi:hypothetical protein B9Z19DRAFT_1109209 [Tuber borchii]|uniref:Uncharacterized protein n=1 Tax=Tuber borchii TaxID=42251 RepID=A0A2T6ZN13_TUBBO|nr:hypothetical protein B9Z19DRAFT_1109209 [Tuber borchii]